MKTGGTDGATTVTGLNFEKKVDLKDLISSIPGYNLRKNPQKAGVEIHFNGHLVARCFRKHES